MRGMSVQISRDWEVFCVVFEGKIITVGMRTNRVRKVEAWGVIKSAESNFFFTTSSQGNRKETENQNERNGLVR